MVFLVSQVEMMLIMTAS